MEISKRLQIGLTFVKDKVAFGNLSHAYTQVMTTFELSVNCLLIAVRFFIGLWLYLLIGCAQTWLPLVILSVRDLQHQISFMQQNTQYTGRGPMSSDDSDYASQLKTLISLCRQRIINASLGFVIGLVGPLRVSQSMLTSHRLTSQFSSSLSIVNFTFRCYWPV